MFESIAEANKKISQAVVETMKLWTDTYRRKNQNYGNSWLLTGQILALAFPEGIKVDTARKFIVLGMVTRMLDKILRYSRLELTAETDKVGEKSSESALDLGVYGFMAGTHVLDESGISALLREEQEQVVYATKSAG